MADLERYINSKVKADTEKHRGASYTDFFYGYMAEETGYSLETIREICFGIDCGSNGFTVRFSRKKSRYKGAQVTRSSDTLLPWT